MSEIIDSFITEARNVSFESVAARFGRVHASRQEWKGACPRCGGEDRYNVNRCKGKFVCRGCGAGGKDAIGLAAHEIGVDVRRQDGLLAACAEVLQRPVPEGGAVESDEDRAARVARMEAERRKADEKAASRAAREEDERAKAIGKARGIYFHGAPDIGVVDEYLKARTGFAPPAGVFENLLFDPAHGYWSDAHRDERGYVSEVHRGPAMIAPFISLEGEVVGCHETWIDLDAAPKCRLRMWVRTKAGEAAGAPWIDPHATPSPEAIEAGHYELMASKKMQGSKLGALIPVLGDLAAARWVAAEGIESVLGFAALDGWRSDTLYLATGAMDNLAGKADPESAFSHPTIKDQDARGRWRARRIPGPVPAKGDDNRALKLAEHVREFVIAVDGDSEPVWTASAIARAEARLAREGLTIVPCWPPEKMDWADVAKQVAEAMREAA